MPSNRKTPAASVLAATPTLCGSASFNGLRAYCAGYAVDDMALRECVVYLSLLGPRAAVRAVWAALMDDDTIEIGRQSFRRLEGAYVTRTVRLPENGAEHMVLIHHQATVPNLQAGQNFYVLNDTGKTPPVARFLAMLDRAIATPLLPAWGPLLWEHGRRNKLIIPLETARGVKAWWVSADDELWRALIQKGIAKNKLPCDARNAPTCDIIEVTTPLPKGKRLHGNTRPLTGLLPSAPSEPSPARHDARYFVRRSHLDPTPRRTQDNNAPAHSNLSERHNHTGYILGS